MIITYQIIQKLQNYDNNAPSYRTVSGNDRILRKMYKETKNKLIEQMKVNKTISDKSIVLLHFFLLNIIHHLFSYVY